MVVQNAEYKLNDPVTVSIGMSDIEDLTALNSYLTRSKLIFASIEHNAQSVTSDYQLNIYEVEDKDTIAKSNYVSPFNRDLTEKFRVIGRYESDKVMHKLVSLPFGGFLTFTASKIIYFSSHDYSKPYATQGLFKAVSKVQCVEFIDSMTDRTAYNRDIFRMVVYTENGNLYLVVFDLKKLEDRDSFQFMNISFQGKMSGATCMAYLNDGHLICGTQSGYFLSRLVEYHTGDHTSPYIITLNRHEECSAISSMELIDKNEYDPKELVVATHVKDCHSIVNLYRRGITMDILTNQDISRISYMNTFELNGTSYLILNLARNLKILKVVAVSKDDEEEEKVSSHNYSRHRNETSQENKEQNDVQLEFHEIFSDSNELVYSALLHTEDAFKVRIFNK